MAKNSPAKDQYRPFTSGNPLGGSKEKKLANSNVALMDTAAQGEVSSVLSD